MLPAPVLRLHAKDNVLIATRAVAAETSLADFDLVTRQDIPAGHKVAVSAIPIGQPIRKFSQIIGFASVDIAPGGHVHVHNCAMGNFERDYAVGADVRNIGVLAPADQATFEGYVRPDGRVGTRNYLAIMPSVNCSASVVRAIADAFNAGGELDAFPNIDGVVGFTHGGGCGQNSHPDSMTNMHRVLWGFARHPNVAGALLVGLGCEANQISFLLDAYGPESTAGFRTMNIQTTGGTRATVEEGIRLIREMLPDANAVARERVCASHLTVALQCGGSDGYSGITANPALGSAIDRLVEHGGTGILAETPEIYGAEHLLTRRAVSPEVAEKLLERIRWWEDYAGGGHNLNNNPSPGNKDGGLTTILEKSLGAAAKGGTTNLVDVYRYGEPITKKGFVFMDSPGYDPCSITGQVASGANIVCFTTGRGSVYGCKPAPSIKLATNTAMFTRMEEDMDVNCGQIADGEQSVARKGEEIFQLILDVASGKASKSEALGFGDNEFMPWEVGPVL
ncbi:MAG: altronate dehydratase family protein [Alphaproteobacteria bacterium]|jgi:altronate hydrolase|nr:altronate dehydratase [Rhodospirillaceae bacterium]MBT6205073.1 altronate dehydratase [Rhodospirillaceae bacterium]MBT7612039.1 altronate dehydratase [Rhodospirillaceae bacterium]MDG2479924.1 altronate dehydratase family protein [Alphaproteobacteria bacterium]